MRAPPLQGEEGVVQVVAEAEAEEVVVGAAGAGAGV